MEPVYIGDPPLLRATISCANGTATLVRFGLRFFAVTCNHVLQEYRRLAAGRRPRHFQIGELVLNPEEQLVTANENLDLAVIELRHGQVVDDRRLGVLATKFFEPASWPPDPINTNDVVSFAGFPGEWREQNRLNRLTMYMLGHGAAGVHSVGETHFYTRLELDDCESVAYDEKEVAGLGGMSGGPVFRWRKGQLAADPVGFIVEYQSALDLLYIRSSHVLNPDGSLAAI